MEHASVLISYHSQWNSEITTNKHVPVWQIGDTRAKTYHWPWVYTWNHSDIGTVAKTECNDFSRSGGARGDLRLYLRSGEFFIIIWPTWPYSIVNVMYLIATMRSVAKIPSKCRKSLNARSYHTVRMCSHKFIGGWQHNCVALTKSCLYWTLFCVCSIVIAQWHVVWAPTAATG